MHIKNIVFSAVFTPPQSPIVLLGPRAIAGAKSACDGGAPHAAVGPGLTGTSPPAGKLHTRPEHVGECAVAAGDPELGLLVPFPWVLPFPRPDRTFLLLPAIRSSASICI